MLYKENCKSSKLHGNMDGTVPLEVGARGTIGSLLKREIEYFRTLDQLESRMDSEEKTGRGLRDSWRSFSFSKLSWRRKKRRSSGIRPAGICSMVEVVDSQGMNEIPGFGYQNLRAESMRFDF